MFRIETLTDEVREVVAGLDAATFDGRDPARLTEVAAKLERLAAAASP